MINEKRKLKREHSNKMLKTISFSCPPEVLLIGNGLNRLLGLSSWQDLNKLLKENMPNSKLSEISDTYKELSFPLQICALNTKSDNFYKSIEEMLLEMANILRKRHKEMPCNIFISAKNNSKHGPRIKIQNNYSTNLQQENMFSMSIPDLKITGNTDKLKEEDIEYYRKFIKRNEKVLLDYWNGVKEIEDVLEELVY